MYIIQTPTSFLKQSAKFFRKHPDLKEKFKQILKNLIQDPFMPHLRLHPLKGKLSGLCAIRLTYQVRITLTIQITEKTIILLDIGSHEEVYTH